MENVQILLQIYKCKKDVIFPSEMFFLYLMKYKNLISCSPSSCKSALQVINIHLIADNTIQKLFNIFRNPIKEF